MRHVVIVGNGIAGITAARHIRKRSDFKITVISGETDYFFSRTALMYVYMGHMKFEHTKPYEDWFWSKNNIELIKGWVTEINFQEKELQLENKTISYDSLVLATGSQSNKFGWSGQDLDGVQGLYSFQDLQSMESSTKGIKHAVVVGGGLIGIEMAEMLHSRNISVTYLVRERNFWDIVLPKEEASMIDEHIKEHGIDLRLETELEEILDDGNGKVKAIVTKSGEKIDCQFVGLTVGVHPNIDLVKGTTLNTDRGVLVNDLLETNIDDVYAIGDCAQLQNPPPGRRPIEAVWYVGRIMGETVARTITGEKTTYLPGNWFNSAKFFDIEYQTYGKVDPMITEDQSSFLWKGDKRCLRFVFDQSTRAIRGINTFGIRLRHEVCDAWLASEKSIEDCLIHLADANFDPEFYRSIEDDVLDTFNKEFGAKLKPKKKSWNRIFNALTN